MIGGSRREFAVDLAISGALLVFRVPITKRSDQVGAGTDLDTVLLPAVLLPVLLRRRAPFGAAVALAASAS